MILNIPLAIWFGILTIIALFITATLGAAVILFKKNMFKQHKIFAGITIGLALIHLVFAVLLWFFKKAY